MYMWERERECHNFNFVDETLVGDGDVEEMDCEERWGDDGEVSMDFDLSEVQQEELIAEISMTRSTILPSTSLDSFSLPSSPATPLYQVCVLQTKTSRFRQ